MRRVILMCLAAVLLTAGFANAADLRYKLSGPWQDVDGVDGITGHGWQNATNTVPGTLPGAADTARANWGGWAGNTITLNYAAPTIAKFQLGVNESGTLVVGSGGSITTTGDSRAGNNNWTTGTLIINGGTVTNNSWFGVATGNGGTKTAGWDPANPTATWGPTYGIVEVNNGGTLNIGSHLWCATGGTHASSGGAPTCLATININDGGVINVNGNLGLGTINAADRSAGLGTATINVNGGLLNLNQWSDWNATTNKGSIQPGSAINIKFGTVIIGGNRVAATDTYVGLGRIKAFDGAGTVSAVYNSATNKTTITGISPMQPSPAYGSMVADGLVDLAWTNMDPNYPGDPVYVDVWFGTDPTWIPEPNILLPGYPGSYVDFTKIVAGQNTTTVSVDAPVIDPAPTTYYWRVDSHIYGAVHNNDPNFPVIEGDVFTFDVTDDFPPTVVIETVDTLTWPAAGALQLNATVSDTGASALTIKWTASDPNAVFNDDSVEDPTVTVDYAAGNVTLTCTVWDAFNPEHNFDTMLLNVVADACAAAVENGASYNMDLNDDCAINLADIAIMAGQWLDPYALTAPIVIVE